ncbi:hypothetical protein [Roseovarius mucosus]|uniref:hypothetical protein n=1 Tax=Roseovarius mucosus TaxID=215743 RepID=UPI0035D0A4D4
MAEIDAGASVLDEPRFGYAAGIDCSGDYMHLNKVERRKAKARARDRREKWRVAEAVRATWSDADFIAEEERLRAQIEQILEARDAA